MKTRILLVNFTQTEADKLKLPKSIELHRGYLSDILEFEKEYNDDDKNKFWGKAFKAYFPLAIHEYKVIFIKFHANSELEKEFEDKCEPYDIKYVNNFADYILNNKGFLVVMLGDYSTRLLMHLGIRGVSLKESVGRDKTVNCLNEDFNDAFGSLEKEVIMPTENYIIVDSDEEGFYEKYSARFIMKSIYRNKAGDLLGCYHSNSMHHSECFPGFFLIPLFRNSIIVATKLLQEFAAHSPKFLPELYEPDWQNSDRHLPLVVHKHGEKISKIIEKAESLIQEEKKKQEASKTKYKFLSELLTQKHDVLKVAVIKTLRDVFDLKVTDSDESKGTTLEHEDIVIEINDELILAEIKGDNSSYPGTGHIAQLWKHLKHKKEIEKGALILNYDVNTEPEKRGPSYTGEEEHQISDIIFIDTRVLHSLAIAVIDYGMQPKEAVTILFQDGRATFNLEEYKKR